MVACGDGLAAGLCAVPLDLLERRVPGRQTHHDRRQVVRGLFPLGRTLEVSDARGRDRRGDSKRDPAAGTGLHRAADGGLRLLERGQGRRRVRGGANPRSVDAIEEVEADIGLSRDCERLVLEGVGLCMKAAVERDLGSPL